MEALTQLAVVWCLVYVAGILAAKTRLTPVLYFLALGALMVNIGILPTETNPFIRGFADLGIIVIMFALGFEENPNHFLKSVRRSWGIAFFGGFVPFGATYLVADHFWQDHSISLMCGLAMTSTAISLTMVSLKTERMQTTPAAKAIITSAVIEDVASLALIAVLVPIASGAEAVSLENIVLIVVKAVGFFLLVTALGIFVFPLCAKLFLAFEGGAHTTLTVLLLALILGLLAHYLGFHPAVGAYMAGLILKEEYFQFRSKVNHYKRNKAIIDNVAFSWLGPIFFVTLGTKIVFQWDIIISVIPATIALIVSVGLAQLLSSALAARFTGSFSWPDSFLIGIGMWGRAELAFIVMDIAYTQHSIFTTEVFYTLMLTAFWLNVAVPVGISLWKKRFAS